MLPAYLMKKTATIWNVAAKGTTTKDTLQRTVLDKVYFAIEDKRSLDANGNHRTIETMTLFIDLKVSAASGNRAYLPHEEFDAAYAADPDSIEEYWTVRPGYDAIGCGTITDETPSIGTGAAAFGGRRDYKVVGLETKSALDGRQFLKVTAT